MVNVKPQERDLPVITSVDCQQLPLNFWSTKEVTPNLMKLII